MNRPRGSRPNSNRAALNPMTIVTVGAFVLAAVFAVLIIKGRGGSNADAPPTLAVTVAAATTASTVAVPTPTVVLAATPAASPGSMAPSLATPHLQPNADVAAAIDGLLAGHDGVYGVIVMKPDGAMLYSKNSETPFVSASLYKLVLLADIYRKIEAGTVSKSDVLPVLESDFDPENGEDSYFTPENAGQSFTVERLLFATGAYSSNVAAKMLLTLTNPASLSNEAALLGMTGTHLFVKPSELPNWPPTASADGSGAEMATAVAFDDRDASGGTTNLTTPADMARYFRLLLAGKIVSQSASAEILDILKTQMVDNRFPVMLPQGTEMAHKTGDLDNVVHDVGVIYAPSGPVILVSMAEGDSNDDIPIEIEQRLALIAYGQYDVPPLDNDPNADVPVSSDGNAADSNASGSDGNASG